MVVTLTAVYFWIKGQMTDLPPALEWLLLIWVGIQGPGTALFWKPILYWFK